MAQKNQTALLTNLARIAPYVAIAATSGRKGQNQLPPVDDTFTKSSTTGREHWLPSTDYPQRTRMDVALGGDLPPEPTFSEVPLSPADLRGLVRALGSMAKRSHPAIVAAKNWYHGTASDLSPQILDPTATKSSRNLFGPGIYLTDNAAGIPRGYAISAAQKANRQAKKDWDVQKNRGKRMPPYPEEIEEKIYEARVQPRKVLDLEEEAPLEVREIFNDLDQSLREHTYDPLSDGRTELGNALSKKWTSGQEFYEKWDRSQPIWDVKKPPATTEDLYAALKKDLSDPANFDGIRGMISYEADDIFSMLAEDFRRKGYDALTHTGGRRTGNKPHQVLIMLDPNDYYNVRQMSSLEGPPGISKQPLLPGGEVSSFRRFRSLPPRR